MLDVMAFRKKLKLSPFVVTRTKRSGQTTSELIMRGSTCIMNEDDETINKFTDDNVETDEVAFSSIAR